MGEVRKNQCLDDTIHLDFAHDIKDLDLEHDTKQQGLEHDTKPSALDTILTKAASPGACVVESRASGAWLEALAWPQALLLLPASSSAKHSLKTLALSASAASAACFSATISSSRVAYASWS